MIRSLTKQELRVVVPELAERCRDMVDAIAESNIKRFMQDYAVDFEHMENNLNIVFNVEVSVGTIVQILSRHERKKRRAKA